MSTTDTKLSLAEAVFAAEQFKAMFPPETYERWTVAGSVRRRRPEVSDVEHVVIPRFADLPGDDIFASPKPTNLFFRQLDRLVAELKVTRHERADGKQCWGDRHRVVGFDCLGVVGQHDLYLADADNYGAIVAIRTGPGDLSKRLVTMLRRNGLRQIDGYVWSCETCGCDRYGASCQTCGGTGLAPVQRVSVPDEAAYFKLCGMTFVPPEVRS